MSEHAAPNPQEHEHPEGAPAHEEHAGAAHKSRKRHGGHGGHGSESGWIVTYCDMVTLLMAFFICMLTFASQHTASKKCPRKGDSLMNLLDGEGLVAPSRREDLDGVVWRELPAQPKFSSRGSETAPMYSDPRGESTAAIVKLLDEQTKSTLADSYVLRIPLPLLFDQENRLTDSGTQVLRVIASNLRDLPYELHLQVGEKRELPRVLAVVRHMTEREGFHPSRLGIGLRDSSEAAVWVTCVRRS